MKTVCFIVPCDGDFAVLKTLVSFSEQLDPDWCSVLWHNGGAIDKAAKCSGPPIDLRVWVVHGHYAYENPDIVAELAIGSAFRHYGDTFEWIAIVEPGTELPRNYTIELRNHRHPGTFIWDDVVAFRADDWLDRHPEDRP
jgi:hypothetical protein